MLPENALLAETFSTILCLHRSSSKRGAIGMVPSSKRHRLHRRMRDLRRPIRLEAERIHVQPCFFAAYLHRQTRHLLRRSHVDHWAFTVSKRTTSDVEVHGRALEVPPGVPFLLSLGEEMHIGRRQQDERVGSSWRATVSRRFARAGRNTGDGLEHVAGQAAADYILLLERNLPDLTPEDGARLPSAIQAMVGACLAPSADRLVAAGARSISP